MLSLSVFWVEYNGTLQITDSTVSRLVSLYTTLEGNDPQNRVCVNMKAGYLFNSYRKAPPILFCTRVSFPRPRR